MLGWLRRRRLIAAVSIAALVVAGVAIVVIARRGGADVQYRTAAATLGTVTQSISLSGNLVAVGETDLGFGSSGKVQTVSVTAGQTVKAGDLLATLDTSTLQGALTQAQANLQSAQAKLSLDQNGATPQNLAQATSAVNTAQVGLDNALANLNDTQLVNQQAVNQAQNAVDADSNSVDADQNVVNADAGNAQKLATDQQTLSRDQGSLDSAENTLSAAQVKSRQSSDQAAGQVSSARVSLANAQTSLAAVRLGSQPQQIQMDQSQVQVAQVNVDGARRSLDQAAIRAPVDGVVGEVNIAAGQSASGSSSGASSSGGSSAGTSTAATGSASSGAGSSAGLASTAAIVILTPGLFQVTGTVSDAQIAQVAIGQRARVLPAGATEGVTGKVTQIAPEATVSSGVATFPVTVALDGTNPSLHAGTSASITVILNEAVHVLTVPTSAVRTSGNGSSVQVLVNGRPETRPVQVGASDALRTEVISGVNEGDQVVIATVSSAVPTPSTGGGGIFGAGGAGGGRAGGAGGRAAGGG